MSNLRPELHVAQQFRRDKLRIQNSSNTNPQNLQDYCPNNLEQLSLQQQHQGLNLDLLQVRTLRNNANNMLDEEPQPQALYSSSEIMSLSPSPAIMPHQYGSSSSFLHSSASKEQCGNWRNSSVPYDWMVNYATNSVANEIINSTNNVKPSCNNNNTCGELHYPNPACSNSIDHNALQDIFNKASNSVISGHGSEMASSLMHWGGINNAQNYGGISANMWINRGVDNDNNTLGWNNSPLELTERKAIKDSYSNPHQGLSLSLSSNSQQSNKPCGGGGEGSASNDPQSGTINNNNILKSSVMKPSINVSGDCSAGKSSSSSLHQDPMGLSSPNTSCYRNVGPLGPFTGYATILKSSRFLKPCQQLLDEYCCQKSGFASNPDQNKGCDDVPEWVSRDHVSADAVNTVLDESIGGVGGEKGGGGSNAGSSSSSMFYGSKGNSSNDGRAGASNFCVSSSSSSSRPECQKNKAKLVFMQEEVIRRYKQYHQQMQMVVSSFESVAGLNSATPYISLALKSVSKHFRCLKNAISDQLKLICEALGEDFSIPITSPSRKFDTSGNTARLMCMEQSFQRNYKSGNMDFMEQHQQHSWRPQRGLPERSVAILKAWLFEHFLHPYPTDTDKHMLATQTGLSRNQVSNWFINARVRVWKPMVEEIHSLETKGAMGGNADQSSSKNEGITSASEGNTSHHHQPLNMFGTHVANATTTIQERQFKCLEMGPSSSLASANNDKEQHWNQEKRSKLECHITSSGMDHGTLMGIMPFRHGEGGGRGLGPVSLTLGLRHGDGAQQQQQQMQHEEQLRRHFGGHMIHDFVG